MTPTNKKTKKVLSMEERIAERMNLSGVTRIAYLAVSELVNQGRAEFLFLREEGVNEWWSKMKTKEIFVRELIEAEDRHEELRKAALSKLSTEERKALGL